MASDLDIVRAALHRLSPIVGRARVYAEREIHNYPHSQTKVEIDRMTEILEELRQLK